MATRGRGHLSVKIFGTNLYCIMGGSGSGNQPGLQVHILLILRIVTQYPLISQCAQHTYFYLNSISELAINYSRDHIYLFSFVFI